MYRIFVEEFGIARRKVVTTPINSNEKLQQGEHKQEVSIFCG